MAEKIKTFRDLIVWKEAHKLVLMVYQVTEKFPPSEKFGLVDQLRRAAVSITSNLAEGFGRNTVKDKLQFYAIAKGSMLELENQLIIAKDLNYLSPELARQLETQIEIVGRLMTGFVRAVIGR